MAESAARQNGLLPDPPHPPTQWHAPLMGRKPEESGFMKIRPLQDRILVKRIAEEETTKGGIIIPDSAKEKPQEGKIVAVGKGKLSDDGKVTPLDVKKGDKILFSKYAGTEINIEGEEHLIIREDDVLGVVE
jgi:chaperonin GroES